MSNRENSDWARTGKNSVLRKQICITLNKIVLYGAAAKVNDFNPIQNMGYLLLYLQVRWPVKNISRFAPQKLCNWFNTMFLSHTFMWGILDMSSLAAPVHFTKLSILPGVLYINIHLISPEDFLPELRLFLSSFFHILKKKTNLTFQ